MTSYQNRDVILEGVDIIFRNFAGKEDQYNREGNRNFSIKLPQDIADLMTEDGWNIKYLPSRNEEPPQAYIQVAVSYKNPKNPPIVVLITGPNKTSLGEDLVEFLDWVDIDNVDLIIRPYDWAVSGKTGTKAYLKSIYITVHEDRLKKKYEDFDELPAVAGRVIGDEPLALEAGPDYLEGEVIE